MHMLYVYTHTHMYINTVHREMHTDVSDLTRQIKIIIIAIIIFKFIYLPF